MNLNYIIMFKFLVKLFIFYFLFNIRIKKNCLFLIVNLNWKIFCNKYYIVITEVILKNSFGIYIFFVIVEIKEVWK